MGIGMKHPQPSVIKRQIYEYVYKGCKKESCRKIAKRILRSNSVGEAMVSAITAFIVDVTNLDEEKARKIARRCIDEKFLILLDLAVFLADGFYIVNAVSDALKACIHQQLANEKKAP